jgi:Tol biopolymer transport system component
VLFSGWKTHCLRQRRRYLDAGYQERQIQRLTFHQKSPLPVWSPDGRKVLFWHDPDGLFAIAADGSSFMLFRFTSHASQNLCKHPDSDPSSPRTAAGSRTRQVGRSRSSSSGFPTAVENGKFRPEAGATPSGVPMAERSSIK